MTYQWQWGLIAMALGLIAGCSGDVRDFPNGSSNSGASSSSSSGGTEAVCGDGVKGGEEQCDENDLDGATCTSIMGTGYFLPSGKTLACKVDCTIDTSGCTNACILDDPGSQLDTCVLQ